VLWHLRLLLQYKSSLELSLVITPPSRPPIRTRNATSILFFQVGVPLFDQISDKEDISTTMHKEVCQSYSAAMRTRPLPLIFANSLTARVKHTQGRYAPYATLTRRKWNTQGLKIGWVATLPQRLHGHHFCIMGSLFRKVYSSNFGIGATKTSPTD